MKKKCIFTLLLLISFSSAIFADVVDIYHLNTPNLQTAYQHLDGWSPIKREIDTSAFDNNFLSKSNKRLHRNI